MATSDRSITKKSAAPLDWAAARERIAALGDMLTREHVSGRRDPGQIIAERTARVATPTETPASAEVKLELLRFTLANETYGIATGFVDEVIPLRQLTTLPCVPDFVAGLVNSRGRIVSVVNMKRIFALPDGPSIANYVIIVGNGSMEFGILADAIVGIDAFLPTKSMTPPSMLTDPRRDYLQEVAPDGTIVLDIQRLLEDPRFRVHDEVGSHDVRRST